MGNVTMDPQKKKLHENSLRHLTQFIATLRRLSEMQEVKQALAEAPADLVRGRTLAEIVLDDTIDAFSTILHPLPDADIPKSYYRTLVNARNPLGLGSGGHPDEVDAQLIRILNGKRNSENNAAPRMPDFVAILGHGTFTPETAKALALGCRDMWMTTLFNISAISKSDAEMKSHRIYSSIINLVEDACRESSLEEQSRLEELMDGNGTNLTARSEMLPDAHGREADIQNLLRSMLRKTGAQVLLHGDQGVGKSTLVESMAASLASGNGPARLKNATIYRLSLVNMVMNTRPETLQLILKSTLEEVAKSNRDNPDSPVIIDIPDYGADAPPMNIQMPVLRAIIDNAIENHPELMLICEVSSPELVGLEARTGLQPSEKPRADRFQKIEVKELPIEATLEKARNLADELEAYHNVSVADDVLGKLVNQADRFITTGARPAKILDILRESVAQAELRGDFDLTESHVIAVISQKTNLPPTLIGGEVSERLQTIKDDLNGRIFGQKEAVEAISGKLSLVNYGMHDPNKPLGVFYLTGPTGVGKTELAKVLSELISGGDKKALITVNLADFGDKHTVSRIVGSPPGFVGYGEKTALEDVGKHPYSVILVDEAEKGHPEVDNVFMRIMDEGKLTLLNGKEFDFRNSVLIFTSNAGASAFLETQNRAPLGFGMKQAPEIQKERRKDAVAARAQEMKIRLKPEFINRATHIELEPLTRDAVEKIALRQIDKISDRLRQNNRTCANLRKITLSAAAMEELMSIGFDPQNGARPMNRAIETNLQVPLGEWLEKNKSKLKKEFSLSITKLTGKFDIRVSYPSKAKAISPE